jgi:hypothetical protein
VKKNRLVVSLYNACTASTLYLYSVTRSPTRLQHQAIWSPTRLQHQALNSRGTSISNTPDQLERSLSCFPRSRIRVSQSDSSMTGYRIHSTARRNPVGNAFTSALSGDLQPQTMCHAMRTTSPPESRAIMPALASSVDGMYAASVFTFIQP